ncbi:tetratricopeptide repeat protein 23 [Engraulis encrasicolus]|uniref:tetratricopeptide repeat protein 23 n=1 Tax=Engraulis encrasicolus TaxID=184585 RepID=UPI002FD68F16
MIMLQSRNDPLLNSTHSFGSSSGSSGGSVRDDERASCLFKRPGGMVSTEMTPELKLEQCAIRAQELTDSQQFDACIQETVRLVALTRLVYGDGHLKQAEAYARLAKAYLKFKGWAPQAHEHASRALSLLPPCPPPSTPQEEQVARLSCLLSACQTQGGAALLLGKPKEAESCFDRAEEVLEELRDLEGISPQERAKTQYEISTNLCRVYQREGRLEDALGVCEGMLEQQHEDGDDEEEASRSCSIYTDMAAIEKSRGRLDKAIGHLLQAHAIAVRQSPGGVQGAHVAHSLALAYSTAAEPHHQDSAAHYFEESLSAYRSTVGPADAMTLSVLNDYSHFLLQTEQQERSVSLQREAVSLKRRVFGDLSAEVAQALMLIGGVEMTQGHIRHAHKTLSQCLEIQTALYGPRHKKTRATQRTVDMLSQAPDVSSAATRREGNLQTRPPFCAVVPSPAVKGINPSMSDP